MNEENMLGNGDKDLYRIKHTSLITIRALGCIRLITKCIIAVLGNTCIVRFLVSYPPPPEPIISIGSNLNTPQNIAML